MKNDVTATVSTRGRYFTTLPNCLISIAMQTVVPKALIIWDDGEHKDLREEPLYQNIFGLLSSRGIAWEVAFGDGVGQVKNHQKSIERATTEWLWRLDDDNVVESDCLEKLLLTADAWDGKLKTVGAVGGLVLDPKAPNTHNTVASNKIEDIYRGLNEQWYRFAGTKETDHLYSTFIYRVDAARSIGGYCMDLSRIGHREETVLTYSMKRAGWKIMIDPSAITWHMRFPSGGIRSEKDGKLWADDEVVFSKKLTEWGVVPKQSKLIVLDCGLGDTLVFYKILPEIKKKYSNLIIAHCYPEVFADEKDIEFISIEDAKLLCDMDKHQIYKLLWDNTDKNWSLEEAYRRMYL